MPTFPDGSRVWVKDANGEPLKEYKPQAEVNEYERTHLITVFIESEKDKSFSVGYYCLSKPPIGDLRKLIVRVDGIRARAHQVRVFGKDDGFEGWLIDSTTTERFAFGEVETNEDCVPGSYKKQKEQLLGASIEVHFFDAELAGFRADGRGFKGPRVTEAVHPDTKRATLVGVSVQSGGTASLSSPATLAARKAAQRPGSLKYIVRFLYRPRGFLVGCDIMPDPNPTTHDNEVEEESRASANAKKRKRNEIAAALQQEAVAADGETAEERKKRLTAELLAIQQELGEVVNGAAPQPMLGSDEEAEGAPKIKPEPDLDPSRPQNEKMYLDLSADQDSDMEI